MALVPRWETLGLTALIPGVRFVCGGARLCADGDGEPLFGVYIEDLCTVALMPWSRSRRGHPLGESLDFHSDKVYLEEGWPNRRTWRNTINRWPNCGAYSWKEMRA